MKVSELDGSFSWNVKSTKKKKKKKKKKKVMEIFK